MNEYETKKSVQNAMNRSLSGLKENPFLTMRIIEEPRGERLVMKKKISVGFVFTLVVVLAAITALAAGLVFSPQYDAKRLANQALKDQYGITDEMMTVFHRSDAQPDPDGGQVFTYASIEDIYAKQLGVYTVTVKDGKASAVWSHDGKDTAGGLEANAWGAEQVAILCSDRYSEVIASLSANMEAPAIEATPMPQGDRNAALDDAAEAKAEAYFQAQQEAWEASKARVNDVAKISFEEASRLAVAAVSSEFGLNADQCSQLVFFDDVYGVMYRFVGDQPVIDLFLHLRQVDGLFTQKDGIYVVTVNMVNGVIEDALYDSGLASNG